MPETEKKLPFRIYTGQEILTRDESKSQPLIQGILFENDYIMIAAKKKSYKSILTIQMACCLSSGTKFLDTFKVTKPQMVWYFATEGKDEDIKDRFIRMSQYVKIDPNNIILICSPGFRFNSRFGVEYVRYLCEKYKDKLPKVIIIDALYMALKGSIKDDEDVNDFTTQVRIFAEHCNAAVIIVHHTRKSTLYEGQVVNMGDEEVYGSAFLLASVDHCFVMDKVVGSDNRAVLKCDTQRSGNIIEVLELQLNEPAPLYLEIVDKHKHKKHIIYELLKVNKHGMTIKGLSKKSSIPRSSVISFINDMDGEVVKEGEHPIVYKLKEVVI